MRGGSASLPCCPLLNLCTSAAVHAAGIGNPSRTGRRRSLSVGTRQKRSTSQSRGRGPMEAWFRTSASCWRSRSASPAAPSSSSWCDDPAVCGLPAIGSLRMMRVLHAVHQHGCVGCTALLRYRPGVWNMDKTDRGWRALTAVLSGGAGLQGRRAVGQGGAGHDAGVLAVSSSVSRQRWLSSCVQPFSGDFPEM